MRNLLTLAMVLLVSWLPLSLRADEAGESAPLNFRTWQGRFLGREENGSLCWLQDRQGNLRLEVLAGPGGLDALLDWRGPAGWTVILAATGDGTLSRWHEEWRPLDGAAAVWMRFLSASVDPAQGMTPPASVRVMGAAGDPPLQRGPFCAVPRVEAYEVPLPSEDNITWRRSLTRRGLGRGGPAPVVRLWREPAPHAQTLLTSSRHPGVLTLADARQYPVTFDATAFLPWWPLRDVLKFP